MTRHYTLMSCNGLEWIKPPGNQSRIPGAWAYHDPPAAIVEEMNRLVDRIAHLESWINSLDEVLRYNGKDGQREWCGSELGYLYQGQRVYVGMDKP